MLPDSFESFFDYYQDDSWIFSDDEKSHLIHLKAVLLAYKMFDNARLAECVKAFCYGGGVDQVALHNSGAFLLPAESWVDCE